MMRLQMTVGPAFCPVRRTDTYGKPFSFRDCRITAPIKNRHKAAAAVVRCGVVVVLGGMPLWTILLLGFVVVLFIGAMLVATILTVLEENDRRWL
jgi:hypothetical protein